MFTTVSNIVTSFELMNRFYLGYILMEFSVQKNLLHHLAFYHVMSIVDNFISWTVHRKLQWHEPKSFRNLG